MTKMTRIALAALAVMGATTAMAQSSVTLYGRINTTVERQKVGDESVSGLYNNASRWGIRGTEDLGGGLLDDGAGDAAFEGVLGRLGGEADQAVALAQGLFPVLDPGDEHIVVQRLPALIDDDQGGMPVETLLHPVEQVHHGRRAQGGVVQQLGHVEAQRRGR